MTVDYENLLRELLLDAKQFAEAASKVAFDMKVQIQDKNDSQIYEAEQFAEKEYRKIMISLQHLYIVSTATDILGLGAYKEHIVKLCAERLLGHDAT